MPKLSRRSKAYRDRVKALKKARAAKKRKNEKSHEYAAPAPGALQFEWMNDPDYRCPAEVAGQSVRDLIRNRIREIVAEELAR